MRFLCFILSVIFATSASAAQSSVKPSPLTIAAGSFANTNDLYLVEWECRERKPPAHPPHVVKTLQDLFSWGDTWNGFGFYFTKGSPAAPRTTETISNIDGLIGAQIVYIVDTDASAQLLYNTRCRGQVITKGRDNPHLQLFDGRVRVANDTIVKITTFLTAAIPPLYNLVVGAALPTKKQQNLTNGKAVLDAYSTVLAIFSRTAGVSNAYPLRVGVYKLRSKLADVTITVSRPESLLLSKAAFKGGADDFMTATVTFAASDLEASKLPNIRNKCNSVIGEWEKVGLKSDIDRAYIAYRRIQPLAPTREAIIKCLGRTYAYSALPYQGKNHFDILADWQFTSDDIDRYLPGNNVANAIYGAQPQGWSKLNATMKYVVERAGRELRGNQADEFLSKFASKVTVEDETAGYGVLASLDPGNKGIGFDGTPQEVFIKLRSAGYQRWGCFVETDSAAGSAFKSQRNEAILTLAYKSSANEAPAVARASAVRVLFEGRVIRSLVFTDYFDLAQYSNAICPGRT